MLLASHAPQVENNALRDAETEANDKHQLSKSSWLWVIPTKEVQYLPVTAHFPWHPFINLLSLSGDSKYSGPNISKNMEWNGKITPDLKSISTYQWNQHWPHVPPHPRVYTGFTFWMVIQLIRAFKFFQLFPTCFSKCGRHWLESLRAEKLIGSFWQPISHRAECTAQ